VGDFAGLTGRLDYLESLGIDCIWPETPEGSQWANFLRTYDELDVGRLSESDQQTVFEAFALDEDMRIYGQDIRRRPAR
jgi:hypothetical protein